MKKIRKFVSMIKDEIDSAECYAEKYIEAKAMGESANAEKYKLFAQQEIEHGMFVHQIAQDFVAKVSKIVVPPAYMKETWEKAHLEFIEKVDEIKEMLSK